MLPSTLRCCVEALHQFGRVLAEEALAVHDADVGMAAAVQDVRRVAHQQGESVSGHRPQLSVIEQREELSGHTSGGGKINNNGSRESLQNAGLNCV